MSDAAIKAALRAATKMRCCRGRPCLVDAGEMKPPCCMPFHSVEAARTIAAFLNALPGWPARMGSQDMADAVTRAAGGGDE